jgi:hypothetical protein
MVAVGEVLVLLEGEPTPMPSQTVNWSTGP